ncbi:hypothetical protein F4806DRAFT_449820, partial [Annulohypoxylon nitens]
MHFPRFKMKTSSRLELFTPLSVHTEPIRILLKKSNRHPKLIRQWSKAKLQELQYVGVVSALMASVLCSAFTWPLANDTIWVVTALWYSGLVFIIAAISTATQQAITLNRFECLPNGDDQIKHMLGYEVEGKTVPRSSVVFIQQIPVMMLRFGVYCFIIGLAVLLGYSAYKDGNWFSPEAKTVTMFAAVMVFVLWCHFFSVFSSYSRWSDIAESNA